MSEGSDMEKTEDATPRKREEARDEGRIPRSQELSVAVSLLGASMAISMAVPGLARAMRDVMGTSLTAVGSATDGGALVELVRQLGWKVMAATAPLLLTMTAVVVAINALQARGTLTGKPLTPDFNRINPGANAKRMLGMRAIVDLGKSLLKLLIVGWAVWSVLHRAWPDFTALVQESPASLLAVVEHYALKALRTAGMAFLALALADYGYQWWEHEKSLRMTKEEVKQEMKGSEGDPHVKQRMRSLGRSMIRKRMMQDVPKADVVVVNPVHIAVALKYDALVAPAPMVLAIGERKVAERIKALAWEHGIPVVENIPLARALVAARVQPGTMIPAELYLAVAEVLAFVIRQRRARGSWQGTAVA